jgi:hypothetical protein
MFKVSEIVKCSSCRKILTRKEFQSHDCKIPWKTSKEIPVLYYLDCSTDKKEQMLGVGLDGTHYFLVVKKPTAISFIQGHFPSDESLQEDESDKEFTEPGIISATFHTSDRTRYLLE